MHLSVLHTQLYMYEQLVDVVIRQTALALLQLYIVQLPHLYIVPLTLARQCLKSVQVKLMVLMWDVLVNNNSITEG